MLTHMGADSLANASGYLPETQVARNVSFEVASPLGLSDYIWWSFIPRPAEDFCPAEDFQPLWELLAHLGRKTGRKNTAAR